MLDERFHARHTKHAAVLLASLALAGCPVTGQANTWTASGSQAETAFNISTYSNGGWTATALFNDNTSSYSDSGNVTYTSTSRTVRAGASLFGWAYRNDGDSDWTALHKVVPSSSPLGIYWGDPALAKQPNDPSKVYFTQLAVHKDSVPAAGIVGGMFTTGAVVYRSGVGGQSFTSSTESVITNNKHFYDGSSLAVDTTGAAFAAYFDTVTGKVDVWRAPNNSTSFTKLTDPGLSNVSSHPRLVIDSSNDNLYLMALVGGGSLKLVRRVGGTWQTPVTVATGVQGNGSISLATTAGSPGMLRFGPQYSFDVGGGELRFVFTKTVGSLKRVFGGKCTISGASISGCSTVTQWSPHLNPGAADSPGDQLGPQIAFGGDRWVASWTSREEAPTGNQVSIWHGRLNGGSSPSMTKTRWVKDLVVCSDLRGYFGDYDQIKYGGTDADGKRWFARPYSDSSAGCTKRWQFTSDAIHLSIALMSY